MKTVSEIAQITGISPRTLHYYDEIGLLHPTAKTEAGYRLYDDTALETLQQILFFREFDLPLKQIKALLENPELDTADILTMQRAMLNAKKERLEKLIAAIDGILQGENKLDFTVFTRTDMERLWSATVENLPEAMEEAIIQEFGSLEAWKAHYLERTAREDYQEGCRKLIEWYGTKEHALDVLTTPPSPEEAAACGERIAAIEKQLAGMRDLGVGNPEVQKLVREYGSVMKALYRLEDETSLMGQVAASYRHPLSREKLDGKYGAGACAFFAEAIEAFYGLKP